MGAGLALAFRQRYPAMFAEYRRMCLQGRLLQGGLRPGVLHFRRGELSDEAGVAAADGGFCRLRPLSAGLGTVVTGADTGEVPRAAGRSGGARRSGTGGGRFFLRFFN